jgi:putative transcriptional regulator
VSKNMAFHKWCRIQKGCACVALVTAIVSIAVLVTLPSMGLARLNFLSLPIPDDLSGGEKTPFGLKPAKGKFLVASRQLLDPNFSQSVVLLIEYHRNGAIGVIINRPSEMKLSTVMPEIEELRQRPDTIYLGGPVARDQLMLLIRTPNPPEESHLVFQDVHVSSSQAVIQRMLQNPEGKEKFRVYAGYAGWAPGQLDHEIAAGGWHVLRADPEIVFDKSPAEIWPDLIHKSSAKWVRMFVPWSQPHR